MQTHKIANLLHNNCWLYYMGVTHIFQNRNIQLQVVLIGLVYGYLMIAYTLSERKVSFVQHITLKCTQNILFSTNRQVINELSVVDCGNIFINPFEFKSVNVRF